MAAYTLRRIVSESYPILILSASLSLIAGFLLQQNIEKILGLPFLIALVPPINDLGGSIGCILGARLSTALHLGSIRPGKGGRLLRLNLEGGFLSGFLSFLCVGLAFSLASPVFGLPRSIGPIFFLAGIMQSLVATFASTWLAFISFRHGLDPDNVVAPMITSICDVTGVASLFVATAIVGL